MLHRLSLRVLPSLSTAVTEDQVRRKKRMVMFVPGLVAFVLYRAAKQATSLSDPVALLAVSGMISALTALATYLVGRGLPIRRLLPEDGWRRAGWVVGWIGFMYGVQLSLLVLSLLWLVGYDYLRHPDGPAMMAIIIACTAVARDAFEIGHVRKLSVLGRPFPTFPDGDAFRRLVATSPRSVGPWVAVGAVLCGGAAALTDSPLLQLTVVTVLGGSLALSAYFGGLGTNHSWLRSFATTRWPELIKYWWWPGLAFASTYYLVAMGGVLFVLREPSVSPVLGGLTGSVVGGMMAAYCYYLGHRRTVENRALGTIPESLLRCPFVVGMLGSRAQASREATTPQSGSMLSKPVSEV